MNHTLNCRALIYGLVIAVTGCAGPDWSEKPAALNSPARILLVRHGEAYVNLPQPPDASPDSLDHLTPRGLTQADVVGDRLRGEHVLVVTSPAGRARETAGSISARLFIGTPPISDDAFAPLPPGASGAMMSGPTGPAMRGPTTQPAPGMAAGDSGIDRARQAIDALAREHPGQTIVIVTHGDVIAGLLGHGIPVGSIAELDAAAQPN
ncbi:MAG: histidine phosphatase family protein [Phycisphaerales bacterium]|nr:histidine phosphatase family protein [Phycisphaerales bacterium]